MTSLHNEFIAKKYEEIIIIIKSKVAKITFFRVRVGGQFFFVCACEVKFFFRVRIFFVCEFFSSQACVRARNFPKGQKAKINKKGRARA